MERKRIYLCLAHLCGEEQKYIQEAIDTNWVVPLGPNVDAFEEQLKQYIGEGKEIVALSSGTAALHLALIELGVGCGDEVIVQSFTFCASANPVKYLGATPIFVDSESDSWNMDPQLLDKAINDRIAKTGKKPKAIIPVSLYGMPPKMDEIIEIANRYEIPVIEDSAEGLGSLFNGKPCGTFGKFGVLSFNGNKMITTSGGGALICADAETKQRIIWYATQAREAYPFYQHKAIGFNYRMSNICAGIGRGQMTILNSHIEHHRKLNRLYRELLSNIDGITLHENPSANFNSNFWLIAAILDPSLKITGMEEAPSYNTGCEPHCNVEALRLLLDKAGVETRSLWKPMHKQPVYADCPAYIDGVSEGLFKRGLCLPSGPCVSEEDVRYIVNCIESAIIR